MWIKFYCNGVYNPMILCLNKFINYNSKAFKYILLVCIIIHLMYHYGHNTSGIIILRCMYSSMICIAIAWQLNKLLLRWFQSDPLTLLSVGYWRGYTKCTAYTRCLPIAKKNVLPFCISCTSFRCVTQAICKAT